MIILSRTDFSFNPHVEISKPLTFPFYQSGRLRMSIPSFHLLPSRTGAFFPQFFVIVFFLSGVQTPAAYACRPLHFLSLPHHGHYCYNQCLQLPNLVHFSPAFYSNFFILFCIQLLTHVLKTKHINKSLSPRDSRLLCHELEESDETMGSLVLVLCLLVTHGMVAISFQFRGCDFLVLFQSQFENLRILNSEFWSNFYYFLHSKQVLGDHFVSTNVPCYINEYFKSNEIYVLFRKIKHLDWIRYKIAKVL